jgi:short-subunit dehydrogenase
MVASSGPVQRNMAAKIAIVFGAGKRIGEYSVETFKSKGFKVARVSRSVKEQELDGVLSIPCDLTQPSLVSGVFEKVRKIWGEPSVIIYNGE